MIGALFNQPNYVASKQMLDTTMLRHEAIASNLANVETPGYKRLDVETSFIDRLREAIASKDPDQIRSAIPSLAIDSTAVSNSSDGNTVQLESELSALTRNTMAHALETQLISGTLTNLTLAITGRPI